MAASIITAKGIIRLGVGKLTILTPQPRIQILQTSLPESINELNILYIELLVYYNIKFDTISLGPE